MHLNVWKKFFSAIQSLLQRINQSITQKNINQFLSTTAITKPVFSNILAQHSKKSRSDGEEIADVMSGAEYEDASVRESRL